MRGRNALPGVTGHVVIVHLKSGRSLRGVLDATPVDVLVLTNVDLLDPRGEVALDGRQIVPRESVDWIQEPSLAAALSPAIRSAAAAAVAS